jgi:vancomycin resistance protein YoaR
VHLPAVPPAWVRWLWLLFGGVAALLALLLTLTLVAVRATHEGRIFPAVSVGDLPVGGMAFGDAASAIADRANAIEASKVTFTQGDKSWSATLHDLGVSIDEEQAMARASAYGREESAFDRLRSTTRLARSGGHLSMPISLDYKQLDHWFDEIDRDLGTPPHNASIEVQGANVVIVPEVDGSVVDRDKARAEITARLQDLDPLTAELPISTRIATVRAVDLQPVQAMLLGAMSHPVQVTNGGGLWTLPATDIAQFLKQDVIPGQGGAPTITIGLDRSKLADWLEERLGPQIETEPVDAKVGWDGEKVVSVEPSVDGVRLDASKLAEDVEGRFFGEGGSIQAPVTYVKPTIDSNNLGALGITTLLGSGQSNYSGSNDGRATNVEVGTRLLNGTLVPPWGEFSFNGAVGLIDEEKGFVEAQVIAGDSIGKDVGGGMCQVSTTVFRAAYLAGLPITEWWPHRFRIGFYELDGWEPGLDASILQPTDDPSTWADFKFENPSDKWMLVESWTDGVNVIVNIYGADLGYQVESTGPTWGEKTQELPPKEVVDDKLDPGTVIMTQAAGIGEELSQYRVVKDRDGNVLWERSFYTKYFPRGEIWDVSPDMKGQAPIDPNFQPPPLPPAGIDSHGWVPGMEVPAQDDSSQAQDTSVALADNSASTDDSASADWTPPADDSVAQSEDWTPPAEGSESG